MPDIFDEVEEDLRAERAQAIGRRYGVLGVLAAVLIVAGTGGYVWWQQKSKRTCPGGGRAIHRRRDRGRCRNGRPGRHG